MDFKASIKLPPSPIAKANPFSKLLFLWTFPLFRKGFKKVLEGEDLYDILEEDKAKHMGDMLERYWQMELNRAKLKCKKPSLFRVMLKICWKTFLFVIGIYIFNQCVIIVSQAIFLRLLIETFNDHDSEKWKGNLYAGGLSVAVFLNTITVHPAVFQIMHLGMKLRVGLSTLIYRKTLRLSKAAQNLTSSGQIINLLSNDCTRFDSYMNFLPYLATAAPQVAILMYLLYDQIGPACFSGAGLIILLLPMQHFLAKYSAIFRREIAKRADERGRFMNEIIIGMRVIKQYAWEKPFSRLIDGTRKLEVVESRKRSLLRGMHHAVFTFAPKIIQCITFLVFLLIKDEPMTADKVFFTLTCLHTVNQTLVNFVPQAAAGIAEMKVAVKRIQDFLLLEEQKFNNSATLSLNKINNNNSIMFTHTMMTKRISMQNACASWANKLTLDKVSFSVDGNKLVMVVGPVGSSKTSLLQTIIDDLPLSSGYLSVNGSVSYASQEPWIFSGNLRQNILFGLPYDEAHYKEILKACALEDDLKQLPYGDLTVVGERGVALSGGQKARVNLARALYRKSDIYLLDDPLSAVDTTVSRHLFEQCFKKHLKESLRILVTHQLQYLPQADIIIVLNHGRILAQGNFEDLVDFGIDFMGLLGDHNTETSAVIKRPNVITTPSALTDENKVAIVEDGHKGKPEENTEKKAGGSVTGSIYRDYLLSGHSICGLVSMMIIFLLCQLSTRGSDYWLSYWTNAERKRMNLERNLTVCTDPNDKHCQDTYLGETNYVYIYLGIIFGVTLFSVLRGICFTMYSAKISVNIHDKMFRSIIRAPIKFFDENPSGRIMNRFTRDISAIDELLPPAIFVSITILLQVVGVIGVVIISNYYMIMATIILFLALYGIRTVFIQTARDIKRIESNARSPVYTHVAATIQGLTTIRSCKSQSILINQFEGYQDIHSSSWFLFIAANRCFGIWLELISDVFLAVVAFSFLLISGSETGGNAGLAISSLLSMMGTVQWGMRQSAETENYMTSVERAFEYSKLTPEAELDSKPDSKPPQDWPALGQIEFNNVTLSYEEGKPVLKDLSFKIRPSEKIGIVGRTGAGKSSIIAALFRLTLPEGEILIDNVPVKQIGLHDLRKSISVITQDAVLFSGSVRYNLDPFDNYKDDHLWRVIEEVELKDAVPSLDYRVADGGANFSVGHRQLVCLARAILRKNKILVMDEATANVDPRTDNLIQQTIRSKFSDCTVITIAHRLHSIIDSDRILVLDQGHLKEYDHPHVLLKNEDGIFSGMLAQTGHNTNAILKKRASESFMGRSEPKALTYSCR